MKQVTLFIFVAIFISSCEVAKQSAAASRVQHEAVLATIKDVGEKITGFINTQ